MRVWSALVRPLALGAALLIAAPEIAAPAWAASPPEAAPALVSPEAAQLGVEVAHRLLDRVSWDAVLKLKGGGIDHIGDSFDDLKARPQWGALARQAAVEEFGAGRDDIDEALGRVFARHFTLDELRAGTELLRGPAGEALAQAAADAAAGGTPKPPSPEVRAVLQRSLSTPAGAAFMQKVGHLGTEMPEAEQAASAAAALGWMRRFCDKATAAEPAPPAAADEGVRLAAQLTRLLFQSVNFGSAMQRQLGPDLERSFAFAPGWPALLRTSVTEEFAADGDALERAGARVYSRYFSVEELRAGVEALSTPDGAAFSQALADGIEGRTALPSEAMNRVTMHLQRTPAGLAFLKKLEGSSEVNRALGEEYGAAAMLGVFRRFVGKAAAAPPLAG